MDKKKNDDLRKTTPTRRSFPKVKTSIKAGPNRREHDHIGNFQLFDKLPVDFNLVDSSTKS